LRRLAYPNMAGLISPRFRALVPTICLGSLAAATAVLVYFVWGEVSRLERGRGAGTWAVSELGYEHSQFLLSVERADSLDAVKLRGDIYLSRVDIIRSFIANADTRQLMPVEKLSRLYASAGETAHLIDGLDRPGGRDALLRHLRSDISMIRQMMMDIWQLDRTIWLEELAAQRKVMIKYMTALLLLLLGLLAARIIINLRMREAGQALSIQLAAREGILASVDAAILGLGAQGEVLYSNRNARELLGPAARSGARLAESAAAVGTLFSEIGSMLGSRSAQDSEDLHELRKVRVDSGSGTRHYVIRISSARIATLENKAKAHASFIVAITDVTSEEEAALRREEYDARLGEASRILAYAAMSGGIVHEISQPLAAMRNYVYTLKASLRLRKPDEEHHGIADQLGVEIDRAIEVVRNIRQMGPQGVQDIGMCDVHEAIAQSIRLVSLGTSPPPPIAVTPGKDPVVIAGSLPMVGQVVVNLLKNALSASSAAGRAGAKVDIRLLDDSAEIAVADFGAGVSDDTARTMFAPFSMSARGGMGLGLAICQRIATNLGGSLSWENDRNAGAVFRFRVPLARQGVLH
jgi:C4-dicarboxylate-specific signal transduction histidine kinase